MIKIQKTTNYSQFKFLAKNRPTFPKYLVESIQNKNLLAERPIVCDIDMNVIDGQNRLKAAEFLNLPIYYIVSENISKDDIGICQVQKPWVMGDYLRFYKDSEDYKFVDDIIQLYSLPIHYIVFCCTNCSQSLKDFRSGKFCIKKNKEELKQKFSYVKDVVKMIKNIRKNSGEKEINISVMFHRALWSFVNKDWYDHSRMLHAISTYPTNAIDLILSNSTEGGVAKALKERLYDFRRSPKNKS